MQHSERVCVCVRESGMCVGGWVVGGCVSECECVCVCVCVCVFSRWGRELGVC